ncbi:hypothetical protein L4G92_07870 [Neisseria sp. ZJ106]|uniref:Inner membrane protein n=1 Tax=Neisseria lisongii TaxID=2912188 RepID=A0ABY7RJ28_9NEIS|nr:hypothetical protein [Neisseria lisongii]MCF7521960.1 hypothetical protein [Neisseria lisongii]WCL71334.1 hypothetical protein PJU73_08360 [Neisseria lisongii]WCL72328.1 hypothetical protein PJU73_04310 [Neisseria lisongii]
MGYQVGRICYETKEEATNVLMTQVVPTIDKDGVLHHPVFNGTNWIFHEQVIQPSFPECEFGAYAQAGREIGGYMVMAFVALLIVVISVKAISLISERDEE